MNMRRSECDLADTNARTSRTEGGPLLVEVGRLPVVGVIRVTRRAPDGALATLSLLDLDPRAAKESGSEEPLSSDVRGAVEAWLAGDCSAALALLLVPAPSPFQERVREVLRGIPRGSVFTYGEVAIAAGAPGGARAVGRACGANPVPLIVPCHRVVGARGAPGGFGLGLEAKRLLLAAEGIDLGALPRLEVGGKAARCSPGWSKV